MRIAIWLLKSLSGITLGELLGVFIWYAVVTSKKWNSLVWLLSFLIYDITCDYDKCHFLR